MVNREPYYSGVFSMAIPVLASEMFDVRVPAVLAEVKPRVGMVYLIKIPGTGGGEWTLDLISPEPTCKKGNLGGARCTVEIEYADLKRILLQPTLAMQLYFQGKIKIQGDVQSLLKLQPLFSALA